MIYIHYLQLCWGLLKVILFNPSTLPPRKPRGDIRNLVRTFAMSYNFHEYGKTGKIKGIFRR